MRRFFETQRWTNAEEKWVRGDNAGFAPMNLSGFQKRQMASPGWYTQLKFSFDRIANGDLPAHLPACSILDLLRCGGGEGSGVPVVGAGPTRNRTCS